MITDEGAQTWTNVTENDVATMSRNCRVGECMTGDRYEAFVMTHSAYFSGWDEVVFNDASRLIGLSPVSAARYTAELRGVFTNVCR